MPRTRLRCDPLDVRAVPAALLATGADLGGGPHVRAFDPVSGEVRLDFMAYDPAFTGGVRVAAGDVTGDGQDDIVTAPGPGGGPHVQVFDGATGGLLRGFFAYDPGFRGGTHVAVADVDGDGRGDVITGPGVSGGPHVRVFGGADNAVLKSFLAFPRDAGMSDAAYYSGATVAGGDTTGDGFAEVIAGTGPGRYSRAVAFDGVTGELVIYLEPIFGGFFGGLFVAAGDINGDRLDDLVVSLGAGLRGGEFPSTVGVGVYSGGPPLASITGYDAYDPSFHGGVRVAVADVTGDGIGDVVTSPGPGGGPHVKVFTGITGPPVRSFWAYDPAFVGGIFVG